MTVDTMLQHAKAALKNAYAPYSNFHVGVCLRTEDNELFNGCNIENVSYSLTLCGESSAISKLISAGKRRIKEILIVSSGELLISPCGACRQRLREFADADTSVHLYNNVGDSKTMTLGQLLPDPFSSQHLDKSGT